MALTPLRLLSQEAQAPAADLARVHAEYAAIARLGFEYAEPPEPLALVKAAASRLTLTLPLPSTLTLTPTPQPHPSPNQAAASRLRVTAAEELLSQGFDWGGPMQPQLVRELLGLLTPTRCALMLVAGGLPASMTEPIYGTRCDPKA